MASGRAKQALMVLRHAILDPKEEVVFPAPYCISDPEMIELAGGVPVPVTAENGSFYPTVKASHRLSGFRASKHRCV